MQKLMIIDGNSLLYRGFYAMPLLTTESGEFTNAVYAFTTIFVKAIESFKPDYIVVAFDYGKKTFRNDLFSEYKGTRKETPPELISQFPLVKSLLKTMNICYLEKQGIEADDIIATISRRFKDLQKMIITGDRDSFQLIDENTNIYLTKKGISEVKIIDLKVLKEEYGLTPSQVVDLKALMGDASDNIPGVKGVGEKTANGLIADYGTLDEVYKHLDELKPKVKTALENDKDMAYLSYKLALNIVDDDLKCELSDCKFTFPFSEDVKESFKKLEFKSLLKKSSLFASEKQQFIAPDLKEVLTVSELDEMIKHINLSKKLAFLYENNTFFVSFDEKSAKIQINSDNSSEFSFNNITAKFKDVFEDESIVKILFDYKKVLYQFENNEVVFNNVFDVAIAKYLIESTVKNFTIDELCSEFVKGDYAMSMYFAYSDYQSKMQEQGLIKLFYDVEMPLVKVLYKMEVNGVKIDLDILKKCDETYSNEIKECEKRIFAFAGHEFNINATMQVATVLYDELKISLPIKKKTRSTSFEILQEIIDVHPIVAEIIKYRRMVKLKNTYIENYYKFEKQGFIHCEFNQMNTDTGRLSSANPNLQNIPVRDDDSKFIREVFVSRFNDGMIASFDYEQIELKLMAHISNDEVMVKAFNEYKDVHKITASMIYGVDEDAVTKEQRRMAKTVNFGIMYGQGAFGLSQQLGCPVGEASAFMKLYFSKFPGIKKYITDSVQRVIDNDYTATTLFGRRRKVTELTVNNAQLRSFGERVAVNMPLQGTASDIIKMAMNKVQKMLDDEHFESKLILQIHDELVFDVKNGEFEKLAPKVKEIMENVVKLNVPLTVSVSTGKNLLK